MCRKKLCDFLNWEGATWTDQAHYIPPATLTEALKPKRIGYPLSEAQILQILDQVPKSEKGNRWRFAIQLCAVKGLRPEELRYLRIKDGVNGAELWTIYQKSMGGTKGAKKQPRRLYPVLVLDADGSAINWNLQSRLQVGEKLPPLNSEGNGSEAMVHIIEVHLKSYARFKANATADLVAAVNV